MISLYFVQVKIFYLQKTEISLNLSVKLYNNAKYFLAEERADWFGQFVLK